MMGNRRKFAAQAKKLIYSIFKVSHRSAILMNVGSIDRMFRRLWAERLLTH